MLSLLILDPPVTFKQIFLLSRLYDFELAHQVLVHYHNCCGVVPFTVVVRRGKYCNQISVRKKFVAVFDNLMSSANQIEIVLVVEFFYNISSEGVGYTSLVFSPCGDILIRVTPEQITYKSTIRDITWSI